MYFLYLLGYIYGFYHIFRAMKTMLFLKVREDLVFDDDDTEDYFDIEVIQIMKNDKTVETYEKFSEIDTYKDVKYLVVNYSVNDEDNFKILFNNEYLKDDFLVEFPYYNEIEKLPFYRTVVRAVLFVDDTEYDFTDVLTSFSGPKLNYHLDIVPLNFKDILEFTGGFENVINDIGTINIEDNFGEIRIFKYPSNFEWCENILKDSVD
jgi:hypothetical protein